LEIILIAIIFGLFFLSISYRLEGVGVKTQLIEKQTSMILESGSPGMEFYIFKNTRNGVIKKIEIKNNKIFARVDDYTYSQGYPFFTRNEVQLEEQNDKFIIKIIEKQK